MGSLSTEAPEQLLLFSPPIVRSCKARLGTIQTWLNRHNFNCASNSSYVIMPCLEAAEGTDL